VRVCAPEDLILHKIVSQRARDREDIEGVLEYRHAELDYQYLDPRVEELSDALADRTMLVSKSAATMVVKSAHFSIRSHLQRAPIITACISVPTRSECFALA
jgi:hypothetical protein